MIRALLVCGMAVLVASPTAASNLETIYGGADTVREYLWGQDPAAGKARVGTGGPVYAAGRAGILFFELPELPDGVAASDIDTATLSLTLEWARDAGNVGQVPGAFSVDLYSLGVRSGAAMNEPGDFGDGATKPAGAMLIKEGWWGPEDDELYGESDSIEITQLVRSIYEAGLPDSAYLVLALYADVNLRNNTYTTYGFTAPTLTLSAPEPTTALLVAFGLVGLGWSGRKARKVSSF